MASMTRFGDLSTEGLVGLRRRSGLARCMNFGSYGVLNPCSATSAAGDERFVGLDIGERGGLGDEPDVAVGTDREDGE